MTALMSACVVVVVAMVAAINLALPALAASDLQPTATGLLWIVDSYILVFGCLLIPAGALADRVGRKGVLLAGLGTFTAGCVASAVAPSVMVLLGARAVTGLGAALVMPATGGAGALGNLGGGLILQWLPWQALFLIIGPLAGVLAVLVARVAPRGERRPASLDPVGAGLLTGSVFVLLLAIIEGPEQGWTSALVLAAGFGAGVLLAGFVAHARRSDHPMLDPTIFKINHLRTGSVGVAAVFFGLFALFFVNAQYLQYAKGYTPLATGIAILPLPLAMIVISRRSVGLAQRIGVRPVVTLGLLLLAAGLTALSFATASTPYLPYSAALVLVAAGMGLAVPSLSTGIVTSLPAEQAGVGSGINSAVREIGAALGVAVIGSVFASDFERPLPAGLHGEGHSVFQTLRTADQIGPTVHSQAIEAFTSSMAVGLRVISAVVIVAAIVVARGLGAARRSDEASATATHSHHLEVG